MLNKKEQSELAEKFRCTFEDNSLYRLSPSSCMDESTLRVELLWIQQTMEVANLRAAASMLAKRYSFVAVAALYSFIVFQKKINASTKNVSLHTEDAETMWLPKVFISEIETIEVTEDNRKILLDELLDELFAHQIEPIWSALRKVTKISKLTLWENVAVYIHWLYDLLLANEEIDNVEVQKVLRYVLEEAEGHQFGSYHHNPLARYSSLPQYVEKVEKQKQEVRVRQTCCLSYQTGAKETYCRTCPVICKPKKGVIVHE
ncbi:IucA/IucC family C-terminal-domain containing protein [Priestia megaterium]|jgi:ferric iron reductase protein FhuF|nr:MULTISPECIES: IucA/IucC family C-terminal-domain containing protein [Priestia]MBY0090434.1 (2Fe-2S)-binding protein [Priestia aryabhattai]MBY0101993.1 (2Fe-2S)-binding protein [Priestia aryabhattai]MCM3307532.1 (2Fe-2S)-binding protein [Priestia megaterium]MED4137037.1 IucA/IucC family C-terminal-domain containing protein [Priestia megaterium]